MLTDPKSRLDRIAKKRLANLKKVEHDFEIALDRKKPFGERLKAFIRGENKAGRTAGIIFDIILLPFQRIYTAREMAKTVINRKGTMKKSLKRAFTNDGGSALRVRDENGHIDIHTIGATLIRLAILALVIWGASQLGIDPNLILE